MVVEAVVSNMGGARGGERRICSEELAKLSWLWNHVKVAQNSTLLGMYSCI
jgi:hypothetical protein